MSARVVVFDLGGVLIDWNPRHLFRKLVPDPAEVEELLATVCTQGWNEQQDAGRALAEATAELVALHPHRAELIRCYYDRWDEMMAGAIDGTVALLEELDGRGVPLYALTNFSAETFPHARRRFPFLSRFRAIVMSGEERLVKPDPRFYRLLLDRHRLVPGETLFIDDSAVNVEAARALGMAGHHFRDPAALRAELAGHGLL
ncbi:MAG TPA: HAD family phosphatase [Kofleriaceae bacterium]|nr:HAD family phosphatase [Kofleriaceae bacterium]